MVVATARILTAITLLAASPLDSARAGMACWWTGTAECRVSDAGSAAVSCRTIRADDCSLYWNLGSPNSQTPFVAAGAIYELSGEKLAAAGGDIRVQVADVEFAIRTEVASARSVRPSSLTRRTSWFYLMDGTAAGALDQSRVAATDLCVATGGRDGVTRLRIWECSAKSDERVLLDTNFAPEADAIIVPFADRDRSFVAVLMTRPLESDDTRRDSEGLAFWRAAPKVASEP